jgi:hypothetical protein
VTGSWRGSAGRGARARAAFPLEPSQQLSLSRTPSQAMRALVGAPPLVHHPAVLHHVALPPEEVAAVGAVVVAPLLVHRARVRVAVTRLLENLVRQCGQGSTRLLGGRLAPWTAGRTWSLICLCIKLLLFARADFPSNSHTR